MDVRDPPDNDAEPGNDEQVPADDPRDRAQGGMEICGDQGDGDVDACKTGRAKESREGKGSEGKAVFLDHRYMLVWVF